MLSFLKKTLIKFQLNRVLSFRRLQLLSSVVGEDLLSGDVYKNILEIGCADGKDFVRFCRNNLNINITGIDIDNYNINQDNFTFVLADAESIDFPDKHFDLAISIGALEHIQPVEKLARVISEIARVSKSYIIVVPSVSTFIEPHTASILWQLREHSSKKIYDQLNYYSDEAWLQFSGFSGAKSQRFFHIPLLISNLVIYKL